jgi:hypothetical protein
VKCQLTLRSNNHRIADIKTDPARVNDCLGEVGGLLEGLANLRLRVAGDLGEFQLMTS